MTLKDFTALAIEAITLDVGKTTTMKRSRRKVRLDVELAAAKRMAQR